MINAKALLASGICAATLCAASPAFAGDAELALLQTYVGSWAGSGVLTGGEQPEDFSCRMTIKKGNGPRINYAGRCSLVSINLSVSGTVYYNDEARRYEGAMSSNTAYSGLAIGRKVGNRIIFDFKKIDKNKEGEQMAVDSKITLGNNKVTVDFNVTFADSGDKMKTSVPFTRK